MKTQFYELAKAFCAATQFEDVDYLVQGKSIDIDGIECALIYREEISEDTAFLHVDFGAPPHAQRAEIYQVLLEQNFIGFTGKGSSFAISPASGHVVYVEQLPLRKAVASEVADTFAHFAAKARAWREHHFLDVQGSHQHALPDRTSLMQPRA